MSPRAATCSQRRPTERRRFRARRDRDRSSGCPAYLVDPRRVGDERKLTTQGLGAVGAVGCLPCEIERCTGSKLERRHQGLRFQVLAVRPIRLALALPLVRPPRTAIAKQHRRLPSPNLIPLSATHDFRQSDRGGHPWINRSAGSRARARESDRSGATGPPTCPLTSAVSALEPSELHPKRTLDNPHRLSFRFVSAQLRTTLRPDTIR